MNRYSNPDHLVSIPAMTTASADALATQLHQKAKSYPNQSVLVRTALERVLRQRDLIVAIKSDRLDDKGTVAKEADQNLDGAWAGLFGLCRAHLRLPKIPENEPFRESAQIIMDTLFRNGLEFTQLPYNEQWSESKNRIGLIDLRGLHPHIDRLGGQIFLTNLRHTQKVYGRVLGITDDTVRQALTNLNTALTRFRQLLRSYIIKVTGQVDDEDPATQVVADTLLAPVEEWRQSLSKPSGNQSDDEAADGEPSDGEPSDGEPSDAEPSDTEPSDTEPSGAELGGAEPGDTES